MSPAHPVNVDLIVEIYAEVSICISQGVPKVTEHLVRIFLAHVAFPDPDHGFGWLAGNLASWGLQHFHLAEKGALAIALRGEYIVRHGSNKKALEHAWKLTNLCSTCKLIGHNKSNHPPKLIKWLEKENKIGTALDVSDKAKDIIDTAFG